MAFEFGLMTFIENNVALVGSRVYTDTLPQGATLPAITCMLITGVPEYCLAGSSDLENSGYDVNIWASTALERANVFDQLRAVISGVRTAFGDHTGVCFIRNHFNIYEPETGYYRKLVEIRSWHKESA